MNELKQKIYLYFITLILTLLVSTPVIAERTYEYVIPNSSWKLDDYNTWIEFSEDLYWDKIEWSGSRFRLLGAKMDGEHIDNIWFSVSNANITIKDLFVDNKLVFTVYAPSGTTSTTKIYLGKQGKPSKVSGATAWSYNDDTEVLTVKVLHASSAEVIVEWVVTPTLREILRSNYYLAFSLISLVPIVVGATIIIGIIKGKERLEMEEIFGLIGFFIVIVLAFIIIWHVMNAIIGG